MTLPFACGSHRTSKTRKDFATERILHLHGWIAYAIIFAVPALEASVFLGFVFPGEIAVLLGGVLAFQGRVSLAGAMAAAIAGAIIGDSVGYEVGRHFGARLLDGPLRRFVKQHHRERSTAFLHRHGGKAVFLGRFTAALRVLVPGFAGMAEIPYPKFLFYNALGGIVWAGGFTLIGYAAGNGYRRVQRIVGRASVIVLGIVVSLALIAWGARWVARNPQRIAAWRRRLGQRRFVRYLKRQRDFVKARFRPGEVFGLGMTVGLLTAAAIGVAFGLLLQDVASKEELALFDRPILEALLRHSDGTVTSFMKAITVLGSSAFVLSLAVALAIVFAVRRSWSRVAILIASPLGALVLERTVKVLVRRPRPPVQALVHASGFSFPSGHAALAAAFYGACAFLLSKAARTWKGKVASWTAAFVVVGLVGFSRMYLRVHYFTDVLGGVALGALWTAIVVTGAGARDRSKHYDGNEGGPEEPPGAISRYGVNRARPGP